MEKNLKSELTKINEIPFFRQTIGRLTINEPLSPNEQVYILSCAILFLKSYAGDKRLKTFVEFSYYIILKYSLLHNDLKPLYDFSASFGFYPITKVILANSNFEIEKIEDILIDLEVEKYRKEAHIETIHQHIERVSMLQSKSLELGYIAPTSYGKSSVIIEYINSNSLPSSTIAIIVPTKSLLMQSYRMIRDANIGKKIIIHDEMYEGESTFIAIFTQERALRLLSKQNIAFDIIFIDEAHNLLKDDSRSVLLSRFLRKNRSRKQDQKVVYLSPLVDDVSNLSVDETQKIDEHRIAFNMKEPELYEYKLDGYFYKYNRFVNSHYRIGFEPNLFNYVLESSKSKNFIYLYRPIKIELFSRMFANFLSQNGIQPLADLGAIDEVISILKAEVHEKFYAVDLLRYGIIYLHGKLPDLIKEYLESKFSSLPQIRFVVANTVILEGMNMPIDSLFILNSRSLSGKDLTNLIGRVNRLNRIFHPEKGDLNMLLPPVHFVNSVQFNGEKSNMAKKMELLRSFAFKDFIGNPTLANFKIDSVKGPDKDAKKKKCLKTIDHEKFLTQLPQSESERLKQDLIESGISSFYSDVDVLRDRLLISIAEAMIDPLWNKYTMMQKIAILFVSNNIDIVTDHEFSRLQHEAAQRYYENYITVAQKRALNQNINWLFGYFKTRIQDNLSPMFFGSTYGEIAIELNNGKYTSKSYIDLSTKSEVELINLAVVKLKIEDEFVSFKLSMFITFMFDYNLISLDDYNLYTYGTSDQDIIALTKIGLNVSLITRLQTDDQLKHLYIDPFGNLKAHAEFEKYKAEVNDFYRFEIERFIN